jgi:hypothetical protein
LIGGSGVGRPGALSPVRPGPAVCRAANGCGVRGRPDLGVYSGSAGRYRTRHGNLRVDGVAAVLHRALAHGLRADDALWFADLDPLPGPAELAARYGDAGGLGVHPGPESVRYLWLDRARRRARGHRSLAR